MIGCRTIRNEYTADKYCNILVTFQEERMSRVRLPLPDVQPDEEADRLSLGEAHR